jgi:acetyltransferase-like isoleucine patch superfamily enzyme
VNAVRPKLSEVGLVDVDWGADVRVFLPANLYGCRIGDRTIVGPFCEIQRGASIGSDCRIQSHSFICDLVKIGNFCFIGHGVMFVNDLFTEGGPANGDRTKWKSSVVGDHVSIGSNATILPVNIVAGVVVGAGAVVTRDLNNKGIYAGNPAKLIRNL